VGASGYEALAQCPHLKTINGISLEALTEDCTNLDLSATPVISSGAMSCVLARIVKMPKLTHLNLSGSNLTSKSHVHALTPIIGSGPCCDGGCDHSFINGTCAYKNCAKCDLDFCSTCCMSSCPMVCLAGALEQLPHLVSLKIADCAFQGGRFGPVRSHHDEEGYRRLGASLCKHESLVDLDISGNYFKGPGFPHLAEGVALMPALTTVKLEYGTILFKQWLLDDVIKPSGHWTFAELLLFARAIARNTRLRHIDLSDVGHLPEKVTEALVESVYGNTKQDMDEADTSETQPNISPTPKCINLETLVVDGLELPFAELQNGSIASLDFSTETLTDRQELAPLFVLMLRCSTSLTSVDFSNQDFGTATPAVVDAALALARRSNVLQCCNGIDLRQGADGAETLSVVGQRPIMPLGVSVLAMVVQHGSLTSLDLSCCFMDATSLADLLSAMVQRQTVTSLDVSRNPLRAKGVQELADFLRSDNKLHTLKACSIQMPPQGTWQEFAVALETNTTLVYLDLRGNSLHDMIKGRLRRTMEELRSVLPFSLQAKVCFLLCNRRLPRHLRLPELMPVGDKGALFLDGAQSPILLIFQYCAEARQLLLGTDWEEALNDDRTDTDEQDEQDSDEQW